MGWMWTYRSFSLCFLLLAAFESEVEGQRYYGSRIGSLSELQHAVKGDVFAVDSRTIHIRGFSYDGTAPDAFFYAGSSGRPSEAGFIIPDENGGVKPLSRYRNKDITLTLPDGKTFRDIRWLSVWCRAFTIDFGSLQVPSNLDYPRPQKIDALPTLEHGVSSDRIVVVDAQTFLIPNFNYDGAAPDGHFWVGKGSSPGPQGTIVPDENGSEEPLKRYSSKTIVITLPGDLTVFDIDFLSVWCRAFFANFGHVRIPKNLNVPPSLKMLGVAPQSQNHGYSYQPPSSGRPAISYKPPKTTPRPSYSVTTRRPTTKRPSYRPQSHNPPSPFTRKGSSSSSSGSSYPYSTTRRPPYQPPVTTTTRRPFYKPPTTTTKRPYRPRPTTSRPRYRPTHFDSDESREESREDSRSRSKGATRNFGGHFSVPKASFPPKSSSSRGASHFSHAHRSSSSSREHSKGNSRRQSDEHDEDDSDEDRPRSRFPPNNHRFRSSSSPDSSSSESSESSSKSKSLSSFHFSNGGSSSSFNLYG